VLAAIQFYFEEPKTATCFGESKRMNKEQFADAVGRRGHNSSVAILRA